MTLATTLRLLGSNGLKVVFSPWYITNESVAELLNPTSLPGAQETSTSYLRTNDGITTEWIDRKLAELSFVGLTVCLDFW